MALQTRNAFLGLIGAGIAGSLVLATFRPDPVPVDLRPVQTGHFEITIDADGITRVIDVFEVSAPITGLAQRSPVRVGAPVIGEGTVVALVEPIAPRLLDARPRLQSEAAVSEAEAALHVAETELGRAREDHIFATSYNDRTAALVERGVASITRLEEAQQRRAIADAALEAADARILQAKGALRRARAALIEMPGQGDRDQCCMSLLAPSDGVVLNIKEISARPVTVGEKLLTVGDPRRLEPVADLLTSDAVSLPPNARAILERWGGPPLEALLSCIEPAARITVSALGIKEQRVDAVFNIVTPGQKRPELGHALASKEMDALLIPPSAAFRMDAEWVVFRTEGDRVLQVQVDLGARNGRFAAVASGLMPNDHPRDDLTDRAQFVERSTF